MKNIFLILLFTTLQLTSTYLYAQGGLPNNQTTAAGKVNGQLIDQKTRQPVSYANIILVAVNDTSQIAGGAMTGDNGNFLIENINPGHYLPKVSLVGYGTKRLPVITISAANLEVNLGTISFSPSSTSLQEVVVEGEREMVTYGLDRKVINVSKDLTSIAGSATDVMKNVPSVTVDVDGGISMRGSSNLRILIDGRPSGMVAADQSQILEQIPASSIESIEIITNPSSKFDAEGEGGIINIILKKEKQQGFNGLASLTVGTGNRYNASLSGNYRYRKFNIFSSYDFRKDTRASYGYLNRTTFGENKLGEQDTTILRQDEESERNYISNSIKIGADYLLTPFQTISASVQYRNRNSDEPESTFYNYFDVRENLIERTFRNNFENDADGNFDYTLGYRKTFSKKRRELTADFIYSTSAETEKQNFEETILFSERAEVPFDNTEMERSITNENNSQLTAQVDYTDPVGEKGRFDAGYKSIITKRDDNYIFEDFTDQRWVDDTNISNNFIFEQQVHSLYSTYGNAFGKTSYQVGGRLELTQNDGLQKKGNTVAPDTTYINFFPSVFITHEFNENNQMQVSYSRRINRPGMRDLNPFTDYSDPLNLRSGNPNLQPEFGNSFEISQIHYGKSGSSINTTAFFRQTNNVIQRFRTVIEDPNPEISRDITFSRSINFATQQAYGLELVGAHTMYKIWKLNGNVSAFRNVLYGSYQNVEIDNRNFSWSARLNSSITIMKGLDVQVSGNYRSPVLLAQGTFGEMYYAEMALKKDVLKQKGAITFRVSDIFNTMQFRHEQFGDNFNSEFYRKMQSRIAYIGFSYRFGDMQNNRERKRNQNDSSSDSMPELD